MEKENRKCKAHIKEKGKWKSGLLCKRYRIKTKKWYIRDSFLNKKIYTKKKDVGKSLPVLVLNDTHIGISTTIERAKSKKVFTQLIISEKCKWVYCFLQ